MNNSNIMVGIPPDVDLRHQQGTLDPESGPVLWTNTGISNTVLMYDARRAAERKYSKKKGARYDVLE